MKRKIKGFFHSEDLKTIRQVVHDVHKIVSNASILVRSYIIQSFHKNNKLPVIDKDIFSIASRIVQGSKTSGFRNTEKRDKVRLLKLKEKEYQESKDNKSKTKKTVEENEKRKIVDEEFFKDIKDKKEAKQSMFDDMIRLYKDLYVSMDEKERYCTFSYTKLFN